MTKVAGHQTNAVSNESDQSGSHLFIDDLPLIRASELVEYSFCRRAWWLSAIKGISSHNQAALIQGVQTHNRHTNNIRTAVRWRQVGFLLWIGGVALLIIAVFYYFVFF